MGYDAMIDHRASQKSAAVAPNIEPERMINHQFSIFWWHEKPAHVESVSSDTEEQSQGGNKKILQDAAWAWRPYFGKASFREAMTLTLILPSKNPMTNAVP